MTEFGKYQVAPLVLEIDSSAVWEAPGLSNCGPGTQAKPHQAQQEVLYLLITPLLVWSHPAVSQVNHKQLLAASRNVSRNPASEQADLSLLTH